MKPNFDIEKVCITYAIITQIGIMLLFTDGCNSIGQEFSILVALSVWVYIVEVLGMYGIFVVIKIRFYICLQKCVFAAKRVIYIYIERSPQWPLRDSHPPNP